MLPNFSLHPSASIELTESYWLKNACIWCPDVHLIYVPLRVLPAITSFFSSASPPFSLMLDNHNYPQGNLALISVLYAIHSPHTLTH